MRMIIIFERLNGNVLKRELSEKKRCYFRVEKDY